MDDPRPIGARLREARLKQGLDLADCAAATRIRERYLVAIEDDRLESLPDPAYVNGFIRAYATHLGVQVDGPERTLPSGDGVKWITREREGASFLRQLSLGQGVDTERISASYTNGVLSVTIPVSEKAKPRKVAVETADTARTVQVPEATHSVES